MFQQMDVVILQPHSIMTMRRTYNYGFHKYIYLFICSVLVLLGCFERTLSFLALTGATIVTIQHGFF